MNGTCERYFRSWTRDDRRNLSPKLALAFDDYDEQRTGRLRSLDWDTHHATYDDEYAFATTDRDTGAWTCDDTAQTRAALEERGIHLPPEIPVALDIQRKRTAEVDRECPACGADSLCSERDIAGAYPPAGRGTAMQAFLESEQGTHLCSYCRRIFSIDITSTQTTRDVGVDLSEAM